MTVATVTAGSQYKNATHKHVVHLKCYMSSIAKFKKLLIINCSFYIHCHTIWVNIFVSSFIISDLLQGED